MTETDPRSDVYTLVAFLAELDRVLHPLLREARGRVRLGPTFPPPLPSFDGSTSPPGGSSGSRTPGPGSRRSASRAAAWGASPEASALRFPRVEVPAAPPLRTEPAPPASSVSGPALPARRAEAKAVLPSGAELPETPSEAPLDLRRLPVSLASGERLRAPTRSRAPGLAGNAAPQLLDRRAVRPEPAPTPLVSTPSLPNAGEPRSTAAPPRLPAPQRTAPAGVLRLPTPPTTTAPARPRTDRPILAPFAELPPRAAPGQAPRLPADAVPLGFVPEVAPAPQQRVPPPHADPTNPAARARPMPPASPAEDLPQASVEFQAIEADDGPLISEPEPEKLPPAPLDWLSLRRGGRLSLSPAELQRVTHKLSSAFLDRALMRHR